MKNLRKVLALVLVVATLCGFATVASATDFSDSSSVKNTEAVEVMNALGVINGYTDGSFKPGNNVTRAEMAKMVTAILNGGEDVGPLYSAANVFTDCGYHWARGYIAYATQVKLVAGIGGGKFNPDGNVTGTEAAKMLLCALGYEPEREGLVGTTWAAKTLSLARESGLTDGFAANFDFSKPLSRDNAALLMLNALKAPVVEYSDDAGTIIVGGVEVVTGGRRSNKIDVKTSENTMKDNNEDLQLGEKSFGGDLALVTGNPDAFGRPSLKWTYNKKEIGTYTNAKPVLTYTAAVKSKDVYKDLGISENPTNMEYYVDGDDGVSASDAQHTIAIEKGIDKTLEGSGNGTTTEIYEITKTVASTEVNTYRVVVVNEYMGKVTKVTKANPSKDINRSITVAGLDFETEDFEKDDYVLYTKAYDRTLDDGTYAVKSVKDIEVVEDVAVTGYKKDDSVTAGGTKYNYSANPYDSFNPATATYTLKADNTYTFYLDSCGNVIYGEAYSATNDDYVLLVDKAQTVSGTRGYWTAYYVDATGKFSSATVYGNTFSIAAETWCTMSDDSDHEGYKTFEVVQTGDHTKAEQLKDVALTQKGGNDVLSKTQPLVASGISANASTIFVLKTEAAKDTYATYTGIANIPSYEKSGSGVTATAVVKDGYAKVIYVDVSSMTSSSDADDLIYLFDKDSYTVESDGKNTYRVFDAIVDGEKTTVKGADSDSAVNANGLLKVTSYDGNGFIKTVAAVGTAGDYVTVSFDGSTEKIAFSDPTLVVKTASYLTDADVAVYMIDGDDDVTEATPSSLVGTPTATSKLYMVLDSDVVTAIYFDGDINN